MHKVGSDLVEQSLVVRDQQRGVLSVGQLIHTTSHDPKRINIETGIGFIKDRNNRLQQRHLQNFIALLFSAGEAFVHTPLQKGWIHLDHVQTLAHVIFEIEGIELLQTLLLPPGITGNAQKLEIADTRNFNGVLETEEHPKSRTLLGIQLQKISSAVTNAATGHAISGMPCQHLGQGAFATAIPTHHRMDLASPHLQIDPFEDGLVLNGSVQIIDIEQQLGVGADHGWIRKMVGIQISGGTAGLSHRSLKLERQQFVGLSGELHRQLVEDIAAKTTHHHRNGFLKTNAATLKIKELIFRNAAGAGFVLDRGLGLLRTDIGIRIGSGLVANQHRIALAVVPCTFGPGADLHEPAVAVAGATSTDALAHDRGAGARAHMNHLGAGVCLLTVIGERHGIKLTNRIGALKHTAGIFPGNGRASFHLGPTNATACSTTLATLGHKVVDTTNAILIAGIPILNG